MIWDFVACTSRTIEMDHFLPELRKRSANVTKYYHPLVLHVCKESRLIGLRRYQKLRIRTSRDLTEELEGPLVYFNFNVDFLSFSVSVPRIQIILADNRYSSVFNINLDSLSCSVSLSESESVLPTRLRNLRIRSGLLCYYALYHLFDDLQTIENFENFENLDIVVERVDGSFTLNTKQEATESI